MGKSIKLQGAALEAASHIHQASLHFEAMKRRLVEITEQEVTELHDHMTKIIHTNLPIISAAVGIDLKDRDAGGELDLRYLPHGLAFVNISNGAGDLEVETAVVGALS